MQHVTTPKTATTREIATPADVVAKFHAARVARDQFDDREDGPPKKVFRQYSTAEHALMRVENPGFDVLAARVGVFAMQLQSINAYNEEEVAEARRGDQLDRFLVELHAKLQELGTVAPETLEFGDWLYVALRSEGIAKLCARDEWQQYAINPEGLAELTGLLATFQAPIRDLACKYGKGAAGLAIEAVYYNKFGNDRASDLLGGPVLEPRSNFDAAKCSSDRTAWDAAVENVRSAAAAVGREEEDGHDRLDAAIDTVIGLTPPDLAGFRFLFDVLMTQTQALGLRAGEAHDFSGTLTSKLMLAACGWPQFTPCVAVEPGNGMAGALVHLRRMLDTMVGSTDPAWPEPEEADEAPPLLAAE